MERGLDWLTGQQKPDGSWSDPHFPALTALALQAFVNSTHPGREQTSARGVAFLRSCIQPDGGIYAARQTRRGGSLSSYNTAICMMTLHSLGDPSLTPAVLKAREYVARTQHYGQSVNAGEFGYDRDMGRAYTDLLNTYYTVEAMRATEDAEEHRPAEEQRADINWKDVIERISVLHRRHVESPEAGETFVFEPGQSKSEDANGGVVFRAYGSMTYAGMMALLYADVAQDDPRVLSALDWSGKHWSLGENPGMGQQGIYFFYYVLTRALSAAERDLVPRTDGTFVNWRTDLAAKLVSLQKIDPGTGQGHWENADATFWEGDPVLVTAYCLLVLQSL